MGLEQAMERNKRKSLLEFKEGNCSLSQEKQILEKDYNLNVNSSSNDTENDKTGEPVRKKQVTSSYISSLNLLPVKLYQCGVCNKHFKKKVIKTHMKIHLGYKCKYCNETIIMSTRISDHILVNNESVCLLRKWQEMEQNRCFVFI